MRLRTNVAKRARVRKNALYLVLMGLVLAGQRFENGFHVKAKVA